MSGPLPLEPQYPPRTRRLERIVAAIRISRTTDRCAHFCGPYAHSLNMVLLSPRRLNHGIIPRVVVHRAVWQRLPRSWRRSVAFSLADLLAPSISQNVQDGGPIVVVGSLRTASGLGESARLCHDALESPRAAGLWYRYRAHLLMQPDDGVAFECADGRSVSCPGDADSPCQRPAHAAGDAGLAAQVGTAEPGHRLLGLGAAKGPRGLAARNALCPRDLGAEYVHGAGDRRDSPQRHHARCSASDQYPTSPPADPLARSEEAIRGALDV